MSRPNGIPLGTNYTLEVDEDEMCQDFDPLPQIAAASQDKITPVSLETVSHIELEKAQKSCPEVVKSRERTACTHYQHAICGICS